MWPVARSRSRPTGRSACSRSSASLAPARVDPDDLGAELLGAEARVLVGLVAAQAVFDVQRRDAVAELAQRVQEAGRVGAARDEAEHLAARLDQLVPADVLSIRSRTLHGTVFQPKCCDHQVGAASQPSSTPTQRSSSSAREARRASRTATSGTRAPGAMPVARRRAAYASGSECATTRIVSSGRLEQRRGTPRRSARRSRGGSRRRRPGASRRRRAGRPGRGTPRCRAPSNGAVERVVQLGQHEPRHVAARQRQRRRSAARAGARSSTQRSSGSSAQHVGRAAAPARRPAARQPDRRRRRRRSAAPRTLYSLSPCRARIARSHGSEEELSGRRATQLHADRLVERDRRQRSRCGRTASRSASVSSSSRQQVAQPAARVAAAARLGVDPDLLHLNGGRRPGRRLGLEADHVVLEPEPRAALLDLRARAPAEALRRRGGAGRCRAPRWCAAAQAGSSSSRSSSVAARRPRLARRPAARRSRRRAAPAGPRAAPACSGPAAAQSSPTARSSPMIIRDAARAAAASAKLRSRRPTGRGSRRRGRAPAARRRRPRAPTKRPIAAPRHVLEEDALDRVGARRTRAPARGAGRRASTDVAHSSPIIPSRRSA